MSKRKADQLEEQSDGDGEEGNDPEKMTVLSATNGLCLTVDLELKILGYVVHNGAFACVCRSGRARCQQEGWYDEGICCPPQQFHHLADAHLEKTEDRENIGSYDNPRDDRWKLCRQYSNDDDSEDDDDDEFDWMGLTARGYTGLVNKMAARDMKWSCCNSDFYSTGCINDIDQEAMEANERARQEVLDNIDEDTDDSDREYGRDWDDSIGGDARRSCTCGYADGVYSYCAC